MHFPQLTVKEQRNDLASRQTTKKTGEPSQGSIYTQSQTYFNG